MELEQTYANGAIAVTIAEKIGTISINSPHRKNALTMQMWSEIPSIINGLIGNDVRCVILRGSGDQDFSAGADISEFDTLRNNANSARIYEKTNADAFAAIRNCPVPVIAVICGICFGGGFGLASAADLRIADESARFAVPAARLGLAYPVEAIGDLVNAAGAQRAKYLVYSGSVMEASEAAECGFLMATYKKDALFEQAEEMAKSIAKLAPLSIKATKSAINAMLSGDEKQFQAASKLADRTFDSADYAEGRSAFKEKRAPKFNGN